jgi:sialic acid synthase SpsE
MMYWHCRFVENNGTKSMLLLHCFVEFCAREEYVNTLKLMQAGQAFGCELMEIM